MRPAVSLSMAGNCRAKIYFAAHGAPQEEIRAGTQRTFDIGHLVEELMLRGIEIAPDGTTSERLPPWWETLGEVTDHSTGMVIDTAKLRPYAFQQELTTDGFVGHVDAFVIDPLGSEPVFILDVKTMPGMTFSRYLKGDLLADPFARQYVLQLQAYMHATHDESFEGPPAEAAALLLFNKENSQVAFRFVKYDPALAAECVERLSWARSDVAPTPEWPWAPAPIELPLVCRYCNFKASCAELRGRTLDLTIQKGKPVWVAK